MRVFLIISESHFFQPSFLASFLRQTPDLIVGAILVTHVLPKNDIEGYLKRRWWHLRPLELLKFVLLTLVHAFKDRFARRSPDGPFYSVRAVLETFGIDYFEATYDINQEIYLSKIRLKRPDVIVSSNPLIFKEAILRLPAICCLNRHSAILPANGGLWPVFQACRKGERDTGVSIHVMEKGIDKGIVLAQRMVPIERRDTIWTLYEKCYGISAETLLEALDKVRRDSWLPVPQNGHAPSYYSFPTREQWREFRQRGCRFV